LRERASLNVVIIKFDRNVEIPGSRERVVNSVRAVVEVFSFDIFSGDRALRSGDGDIESFAADSFELVGLGLGANRELEFFDEGVFEVSAFFDVDGVRAVSNGIMFQVSIDGVFSVVSGMISDGVSSIIIINDFNRDIAAGAGDLNFEGISSAAHVVTEPVASFDVKDSGFSIIGFFKTRTIHKRMSSISSRNNGDIVRTVFDMVVEERMFGSEQDIDSVDTGFAGLIRNGISTVVVIDNFRGARILIGFSDFNFDGSTSMSKRNTFRVFGDDCEDSRISGVTTFNTRSINIELSRIRI